MELRAETSVFDDKLLKEDIDNAQETADNAQAIAGTTAQYFWFLEEIGSVPAGVGTGAHITNVTKEEFLNNPANGGGNLLARSNGIAIRDGLTELAYFSGTAAQIGKSNSYNSYFDTQSFQIRNGSTLLSKFTSGGTDIYLADDSANSVASFGTTARIGKADRQRIVINPSGIDMYGYNASASTANQLLCHIGFSSGNAGSGTAIAPYFTFGTRTGTIGNYSVAEGTGVTASGYLAHAEGNATTASGGSSHAEGVSTIASGSASHAEGRPEITNAISTRYTTASGTGSHAEGGGTYAQGHNSHSEGRESTASGDYSHSEGYLTTASGIASHAEGRNTVASGNYTHTTGIWTTASGNSQTVIGRANILDTTSAFIIGNGAIQASDMTVAYRDNAMTVDWSGNVWAAGGLTIGGHSSAVGTMLTASQTSSRASSTELGNLSNAYIDIPAGSWVITLECRGDLNSSGKRLQFEFYNNTDSTEYTSTRTTLHTSSTGVVGGVSTLVVSITATKRFYCRCYQNSGSAVDLTAAFRAMRVA